MKRKAINIPIIIAACLVGGSIVFEKMPGPDTDKSVLAAMGPGPTTISSWSMSLNKREFYKRNLLFFQPQEF
jgi:hypothetical protein